ncbi:glycerol-3-phosphate dehydrogenase [Aerococcus urinaehominis]|uniref:Glycerol-3-phosphate dehydrogenase [NAD(P)+] n=1 Tax=Aerococcus urinaehominis TaxID=128944 RepID=A0A0X8FLB8_9LACT|nr:NAD(P)H-dependent glycerol-3-phosphate dehydrogenase [Aerococcus urinaehominis]AMB99433.1 glycerol-3-phosphate dehydrogenase [Aerococcus urinaehominis]SDM29233.1 glycerol 3-phosphate dehydrogenase (NAD(P)+) [Aerococcus urinaehominis]
MSKRVSILGAGSWGTALASVLAKNKQEVLLWSRDQGQIERIRATGKNADYLADYVLPANIQLSADLAAAVDFADIICFVVPTKAIRTLASQVANLLKDRTSDRSVPVIMHASKGLEQGSHLRISQVLADSLAGLDYRGVVVLSGPSHAEEVVREDITAITAASQDDEAARLIQTLFSNDFFRVYTNTDVIGVELGGALKNIIALGAGALVGLGYGDNAKAALVTRGLAEISRLGVAMGADPLTFAGLSGVGDLVVTATSPHSRNWQAGRAIAQGQAVKEVEGGSRMVVEGISTAIAANELAAELEIDMPITQAIYDVVYLEKPIRQVINNLMRRKGKGEVSMASQLADASRENN